MTARVGIIGGSGLYDLAGLSDARDVRVPTPFGDPSDAVRVGLLGPTPVAFLARHGRAHGILPSEINSRANILALKELGCDAIIAVSAVGSLREEIAPEHICVPDQFIDRTRHRTDTFFGCGIVAHVSLADPVCPEVARAVADGAREADATVHRGGVYVCMEGPQFSTRAESNLYRSWGADVIGMTNLTEARLAREAEICYATMALVTDYDCWRENTEAVSVDGVLSTLRANAERARRVLGRAVPAIAAERACACREALKSAIITSPDQAPAAERRRLAPLLSKYWK